MINPHNVCRLVLDYVTELIPSTNLIHTSTPRDEDVARSVYCTIEAIFNSTHYCFDTEQTLDFIDDYEQQIDNNEVESEDETDEDYKEEDEKEEESSLLHEFSLQYMKRVVEYFDETNPTTGKRCHSWANIQHNFRRVKNRSYIQRFRDYLTREGTKERKLQEIDAYVYDSLPSDDLHCCSEVYRLW